jgi:hypothetical protein
MVEVSLLNEVPAVIMTQKVVSYISSGVSAAGFKVQMECLV